MPLEEVVLDHQVIGEIDEPRGRRAPARRRRRRPRVDDRPRSSRPSAAPACKRRGHRPRRLRPGPHAGHPASAPDDSARVYCHLGRHHQPGDRARLELPLHPPALRPPGTTDDDDGRQRPGRGDPPVDRLLHGAARGALGRRGRPVRPRLAPRRPGRRAQRPAPASRHRRRAARHASTPASCRSARTRTATRSPPASPWEPRHEARQPSPREAPPAPADRRPVGQLVHRRSACSALSCWSRSSRTSWTVNKITTSQDGHRGRRAEGRRRARPSAPSSSARSATSPRSSSSASPRSRQLADGRFDWERTVRELAHVLPDGVWLTRLRPPAGPAARPRGRRRPDDRLGCRRRAIDASLDGCAPAAARRSRLQ